MTDLIKREDAIKVVESFLGTDPITERIKRLPSADRSSAVDLSSVYSTAYKSGYEKGKADGAMIYGNEHNCVMTIFGECSYAETGCGDCAVVEKVRKALSADRPQGEWVDAEIPLESGGSMPIQACSLCKTFYPLAYTGGGHRFCPNCGCRMKGADDEID